MCHNSLIKMRFFLGFLVAGVILAGGFFLLRGERVVEVTPSGDLVTDQTSARVAIPQVPEAEPGSSSTTEASIKPNGDIENQGQLLNPPEVVKAIYVTGWSAGSAKKMDYLVKLVEETEINAVVIDIKDYSGYVSYFINLPIIKESGALDEPRILKPNTLVKKLHEHQIYVIGRISVFQDSVLAKSHPEWAVRASSTGELWKDRKGLAWMDPASREVWGYNLGIARDALARGFDEINFDYIRFPSDGNLEDMVFPFWREEVPMSGIMEDFFKYLRGNLDGAKISADLFGLATIDRTDLGIGQVIEKVFPYFDYVAPMVYPSHYAAYVFGYQNPANYPYEVVKNSMAEATKRLVEYNTSQLEGLSSSSVVVRHRVKAKIRPWLQDFDLGADYDAAKVRAQIKASDEAGGSGFMLWDPNNNYTREALLPET